MNPLDQIRLVLRITRTHSIVRRYFVVNGFDGALTMLGLFIGFIFSSPSNLSVIINACMGAAIALGVSGVSSAYISEQAEQQRSLSKLEDAMVADLQEGVHGKATRWVPMLIALVNGSAPLIISILVITPLWLANSGVTLFMPPLYLASIVALIIIFLLGVFLGQVSNISWLRSGVRTLLIAIITILLISLFAAN